MKRIDFPRGKARIDGIASGGPKGAGAVAHDGNAGRFCEIYRHPSVRGAAPHRFRLKIAEWMQRIRQIGPCLHTGRRETGVRRRGGHSKFAAALSLQYCEHSISAGRGLNPE